MAKSRKCLTCRVRLTDTQGWYCSRACGQRAATAQRSRAVIAELKAVWERYRDRHHLLNKDHYAILQERVRGHKTLDQIADRRGCTKEAVRQQQQRAIAALKAGVPSPGRGRPRTCTIAKKEPHV